MRFLVAIRGIIVIITAVVIVHKNDGDGPSETDRLPSTMENKTLLTVIYILFFRNIVFV